MPPVGFFNGVGFGEVVVLFGEVGELGVVAVEDVELVLGDIFDVQQPAASAWVNLGFYPASSIAT